MIRIHLLREIGEEKGIRISRVLTQRRERLIVFFFLHLYSYADLYGKKNPFAATLRVCANSSSTGIFF